MAKYISLEGLEAFLGTLKSKLEDGSIGVHATDAYIGTTASPNMCTNEGLYQLGTSSQGSPTTIGFPVMSPGTLKGRLLNIDTTGAGGNVISQFLMLNNNTGGEGGIYVRSIQNNTAKPWGRLQTNVEVGIVTLTALDNDPFLDNGIYSGVCSDTGETFVLICINNYAAAPQNQSISQLKYSLYIGSQDGLTPGAVKIEKRSRNMTGIWSAWEEVSPFSPIITTIMTNNKLLKNKMYVLSGDINITQFEAPAINEHATYTILVQNGTISLPAEVYWAHGEKPSTSNGIYEVVVNGINNNGSIIYTATWANYSK